MPRRIPLPPISLPPSRPVLRGPVFRPPAYDISIPDNLWRPPRTTDVTVNKGFDGLTPDQALGKVERSLANRLAPENKQLLATQVRERHRDFTMAVSNAFIAGSPPATFLAGLNATSLSVLGTLSAQQPVVYKAMSAGNPVPSYFASNGRGGFTEIAKPRGTVVMEAQLRLTPPGVAVSYPKWSLPALAQPAGPTITEL